MENKENRENKRNIKQSVIKKLYAESGNICAMYGCESEITSTTGEICHINVVNEKGARYNPDLPDEYINSYDNLLLLCPTHHAVIDRKENEKFYTVEYLKKMKADHVEGIRNRLSNSPKFLQSIQWENYEYSVKSIIRAYYYFLEKKLKKEHIFKTLELVLAMSEATRRILYETVTYLWIFSVF